MATRASSSTLSSRTTIDAGIVLADRAGYFCLPLEQMGLPSDAQIVSLESSCDCVQPRLVQYLADRQQTRQAILLEYVAEESSSDGLGKDGKSEFRPVHLGVMIDVGLASGEKHNFTVDLLHTVLNEATALNHREQQASVDGERSVNRHVSSILTVGEL